MVYEAAKMNRSSSIDSPTAVAGAFSAATAFVLWGLAPIYWKQLLPVPAFQILLHRTVWCLCFLLPLLWWTGSWKAFVGALGSGRCLGILAATSALLSVNWFIFIWAVNHDRILQTSLGYYINPLVNVFLGMVFLRERLRRAQKLAVALAALGVLALALHVGRFPWVSLALAFSFGFYGLIRKVAPVGALPGLAVETLFLSLPAAAVLAALDAGGTGAFLRIDRATDLLLVGSGLLTAVPLLCFTFGARRIHLTTVGFLQYIAPSCTFLLAVFVYREPISSVQVFTFFAIWTALAIHSADTIRYRRRIRAAARRLQPS
jgi:chloramphenicol-sensitive protein RarD